MKIRNPNLIRWVSFFGAVLIRIWIGTLSYRQHSFGINYLPNRRGADGKEKCIFAFWHENILVPCSEMAGYDVQVLISEHADGEIIAQICKHLGYRTIRGSKTRGGMKALRSMIRASNNSKLTVVPDGPRGPRRHVEFGLIYLAAKTGLPIVLLGVGYDRPWRVNTWDRLVLPRPFTKTVLLTAAPIYIPEDADKSQLEEHQKSVEDKLNKLTDYAERLASN